MLSEDALERLRMHLIVDEGLRLKPYQDTVGKWTIGVGRNLTDVGISRLEAYDLLNHDIDRAYIGLVGKYHWFEHQDPVRQAVLTELCFNMGIQRLSLFTNTLGAFERKDYPAVVDGLKASKWYRQVQATRSARLIKMTLTGEWS